MDVQEAKTRAATGFNAAADLFDDPRLSFWDRFGRRTIDRLGLRPGDTVLDLCCGTGASALAAAEKVGPAGRVLGLDLAENLIRRARVKAAIRRLGNVELRVEDLEQVELPPASFDAVVCVFGLFFLQDMAGALRRMWRWVRPGGRLAVTTWGPRLFHPADELFWEAVRAERPDLHRAVHPRDRIADPEALRRLFERSGIPDAGIEAEAGFHPTPEPEDWWTVVMSTGYRGTVEALDAESRARVRARTLRAFAATGARQIETNVVYAVAVR
ncbi:MAG TPA: methyltransferase domain-containing protein [Thermoanaerobaculia bacterium]|nr:methyltransferase domain-containing protein [Thermoanaerobaculia bacterium]